MTKTRESKYKNVIGSRVRLARLAIRPGVSQDDLSGRLARAGVQITQTSLSKLENRQRYVMDYEALALAKVLKVSVARLYGEAMDREEFGDFLSAEVFAVAKDLEEAVPEEFGDGGEAVIGHSVEAAFFVEQAVGGEDMEVRVEDEVIPEGVDGGSGGDATGEQVEAGAEGVAQAFGGGLEKEMKEVAAFAENAAQHLREGEHELAVGDVVADGGGDPCASLSFQPRRISFPAGRRTGRARIFAARRIAESAAWKL